MKTNIHFWPYVLTPWCRVLLEKLTGLQPVKKFPAFHGTRRFITAHTTVRRLSLSWGSPIQSIYPHPTSWRSILILSTHLRLGLPSGLFPSGFPTKTLYTPSPHPYVPHVQPISFFSILSPAQYWVSSTNHCYYYYYYYYYSELDQKSNKNYENFLIINVNIKVDKSKNACSVQVRMCGLLMYEHVCTHCTWSELLIPMTNIITNLALSTFCIKGLKRILEVQRS